MRSSGLAGLDCDDPRIAAAGDGAGLPAGFVVVVGSPFAKGVPQ